MNFGVIHTSGAVGREHADITSRNATSRVTEKCPMDFRSDLVTRRASSGSTARGSGDHQPRIPSGWTSIGKSPVEYACSRVPGSRSAPTPTRSSPACAVRGSGSSHWQGGTDRLVTSHQCGLQVRRKLACGLHPIGLCEAFEEVFRREGVFLCADCFDDVGS